MPTSLEGIARPPEMLRGERLVDSIFEATERLYRRIDPEYVHEYEPGKLRLITTHWAPHNISVVRGKYAQPDHARWDSALDPGNPEGFQPKLWRDWYVFEILVNQVPETIKSPGNTEYTFAVAHEPFDDLYSHSEIRASKGGQTIARENKFKNDDVKLRYRTALAESFKLVLRPNQTVADAPA